MDITPFDLGGAFSSYYNWNTQKAQLEALKAKAQNEASEQNALATAVPMLQSDPQNAFAAAAKQSPSAALKILPYIKQMDDAKKAAASEKAEALARMAYTLKSQYGDPVIRKAVARSMAPKLAELGFTPDQIQNFDYSDQNLQGIINQAMQTKDLITQSNTERDDARADAELSYRKENDAADRAVTIRGQNMTDARARDATKLAGKITDTQRVTALYAERADQSNRILNEVDTQGTDVMQRAKSSIPGIGNFLVSSDYQKFDQAKRDFVNAVLRKESGAVISDEEFANAERQYFPQPGDSKTVIAQKRANRETAIKGLRRAAGGAVDTDPGSAPDKPKVIDFNDLQ